MLTEGVADFFRKTRVDAQLGARVIATDSYQGLAELSRQAGAPVAAGELRSAFVQRNAGVLVQQMMRRGVVAPYALPPVPALDQELWSRVLAMDLNPVVGQLVTYRNWTAERATAAERRYRRFFYLKAALPEGNASPTPEVDEFWHQHIINTRAYEPDCLRVAGRFLHHTFLSPDDPAEAREIESVWFTTWVCYEDLFEEPYEETVGAALLGRWPKA